MLKIIFLQQNMRIEKFKKPKKPKARPKTSSINKFAANFENNVFLLNKNNMSIYRCRICKHETPDDIAEYLISSGNSGFRRHLESIHRIEVLIRQETIIQRDLQNVQKLTDYDGWSYQNNTNIHQKKQQLILRDIYDGISENHVRTLLLAWLLKDNLPLSTVTTLAFQRFFARVLSTLSAFISRSNLTIRKDLEVIISSKMPETCSSV